MFYNTPKTFLVIALIFTAIQACSDPVFGIQFAQFMTLMTQGIYELETDPVVKAAGTFETEFMDRAIHYTLMTALIAVSGSITAFIGRYYFARLSNNVTIKIRAVLYESILRKNIGWFDQKENAPGVLTATMAEDTAILNGVSSDSVSVMVEGLFSVGCGVTIGFWFCWQVSLLCLACVPLMIIGSAFAGYYEKQKIEGTDKQYKEANMIAGDALMNYKTILSFAEEEKILGIYQDIMDKALAKITYNAIMSGLALGGSQFMQNFIF